MKHVMQMLITFFLCMMLLGFLAARNVNADTSLVVPFYTYHIQHHGNKQYNENFKNTSLGIQHSDNNYTLGATYVHKNSYKKQSLYTYALLENNKNTIHYGGGLLLATGGYDVALVGAPILSASYGMFRLVTTYPFGNISGNDIDLLNIQLIIPL